MDAKLRKIVDEILEWDKPSLLYEHGKHLELFTATSRKAVNQLRKYMNGVVKSEMEYKRKDELKDLREKAADDCFENSDLDGLTCVDHDGWETSGDYFNKTFYFEDEENPDGDSKRATFVVIFKKDSDVIEDSHVNIW